MGHLVVIHIDEYGQKEIEILALWLRNVVFACLWHEYQSEHFCASDDFTLFCSLMHHVKAEILLISEYIRAVLFLRASLYKNINKHTFELINIANCKNTIASNIRFVPHLFYMCAGFNVSCRLRAPRCY